MREQALMLKYLGYADGGGARVDEAGKVIAYRMRSITSDLEPDAEKAAFTMARGLMADYLARHTDPLVNAAFTMVLTDNGVYQSTERVEVWFLPPDSPLVCQAAGRA